MDFSRLTDPQAYKQALAGLLRRGGEVTDFIATAPEKAGQAILEGHEKNKALQAQAFANPNRPFQVTNQQAMGELGDRMLAGPLSVAPVGMIAYHGTPHLIKDKFDISKVGTGEGAQVYGHGMYFAENPKVAEGYKEALSGKPLEMLRTGFNDNPELWAAGQLYSKISPKDIKESLQILGYKGNADNLLKSAEKKLQEQTSAGNLYKVDIPDEFIPNMLSWDKPLREQPEILKTLGFDVKKYDKLKAQRDAMPEKFDIDIPEELAQYNKAMALEKQMREMPIDVSGKYFYESLIKKYGTQKAISEALTEKGIKGIRYLDAGSRGKAAERSSNFVVFDPTNVKLLERNNQPISRKELIQQQIDKIE
jgi:hypothetical protein